MSERRWLSVAGFVLCGFWLGEAIMIVATGSVSVFLGTMMATLLAFMCFLQAKSVR